MRPPSGRLIQVWLAVAFAALAFYEAHLGDAWMALYLGFVAGDMLGEARDSSR